jgi:hypothetical protein
MGSIILERIRKQADALSEAEKFELADHLLQGAHGMTAENDQLWRKEVRNRVQAIDDGSEKMMPWQQFETEFNHLETRSSQQ